MSRNDRGLMTARTALRRVVRATPDTIDDVVVQLGEIDGIAQQLVPRGKDDGIANFTRLYLEVTEAVRDEHRKGLFSAGDFILRLDVAFARRYLDALRVDLADSEDRAPRCWRLLFDARRDADVDIWRFAALGVNAHVNYDLAFALLDVWEEQTAPATGKEVEAQHADYDRINEIFAEKMDGFLHEFHVPGNQPGPASGSVDELIERVCGLIVRWTRAHAWDEAIEAWEERHHPHYRDAPTRTLDRTATFVGRLVLAMPL